MNRRTKLVLTLGIAAVLAGSGTALAASNQGGEQASSEASGASAQTTDKQFPFKHAGKGEGFGGKVFISMAGTSELPNFLGMTEAELRSAQESGKTLAQIAADKGISEEKLIEFMLTEHKKQIDQLLADGKIEQEQADKMKEHMTEEQIKAMVEGKGPQGIGHIRADKVMIMPMNGELPKFLGMTEGELRSAQESGKTLAQIAEGKGISEEKLIEFMLTEHQKQIDQLLADGKIEQEQADKMKEHMTEEQIKAMVEGKGPQVFGHKQAGKVMMMPMQSGLPNFLGLTEAEFRSALKSGKTLAQVAADKGISEEKLIEFMQAEHQKQIDQLLADGKITQEQADSMKERMTAEQIKEMINGAGHLKVERGVRADKGVGGELKQQRAPFAGTATSGKSFTTTTRID